MEVTFLVNCAQLCDVGIALFYSVIYISVVKELTKLWKHNESQKSNQLHFCQQFLIYKMLSPPYLSYAMSIAASQKRSAKRSPL